MFLIHAAVTFGGSVREHLAQGEMRPVCSETACVQILHCANLLCDPVSSLTLSAPVSTFVHIADNSSFQGIFIFII